MYPSVDSPQGDFESRLTWIFGSARTGSTWLLRMLIHPWTLANNELGVRAPSGPGLGPPRAVPINESHLPLHTTPQTLPDYEGDTVSPPDAFVINTRRASDTSYFFNDLYADAWRPLVRQLILGRFHAQVRAMERALGGEDPMVVIKEPNGSHGAQLVMELLPSARIVFLMRDGRDVVDSQIALRIPGGAKADGSSRRFISSYEKRLNEVLRTSRLWVNNMSAVQAAYQAHPPELRYMLRYEELRRDTFEQLRALRAWMGLPADDQAVEGAVAAEAFEAVPRKRKGFGKGKRAAEPGHWRKTLTSAEQAIAEQVMRPKLEELGYPV